MPPRIEAPWTPAFSDVEGAAANIARRNLWRVRPLYDFEDLMQEAHLWFLRLVRRYPRVVDPPHFMTLFVRSFGNQIHTLASSRSRSASGHLAAPSNDPEVQDPLLTLAASPIPPNAEERLFQAVASAPPTIQALVRGVLNSPRKPRRRRTKAGARETTNTFLCRMAGVEPGQVDMRRQLDMFFGDLAIPTV